MPYLNAFRLRWWSKPHSKPGPPSFDDSDRSSSPERVQRRFSLHIGTPTEARRSVDRARNVHYNQNTPAMLPPTTTRLSHDEVLNEKSSSHHLEQPGILPTDKYLLRSNTTVHKSSSSSPTSRKGDMKPSLIRRMTSKLRITVPATTSSPLPTSSAASPSLHGAKHSSQPPLHPTLCHSPTLPNSFISRELREAALRERGLRPPRKDLSEQEREADERSAPASLPVSEHGEKSSAASKIKDEWLFMNRSTEHKASDPTSALHQQQLNFSALASRVAPLSHPGPELSPTCASDCHAGSQAEIPLMGRSSMSSTIPPLSLSSHLEVLQEEPAEHVLPSLRVQPPIVISTPVDNSFPPSSPVFVESPVSCTFSSHLAPPGSLSQPHISPPGSPTKENSFPQSPKPPARRRTTNSSNRSHSSVGISLSKSGTNSLTNLRRSVIGSIRHSGSSADLSISSSQPMSPRVALSPTIHSRESIMFEANGIKDVESRRLSELAFLD